MYWFVSEQQWTFSTGTVFKSTTSFDPTESDQIQYFAWYPEQSFSANFTAAKNSTGDYIVQACSNNISSTYFPPNLITALSGCFKLYIGEEDVNGDLSNVWLIDYYPNGYGSSSVFVTYKWYESVNTKKLLRIELLTMENTMANAITGAKVETSQMFYDFSDVFSVEISSPGNWWKRMKTAYPTCDSICTFGSCNQIPNVYHPEAPLEEPMDGSVLVSHTPTGAPTGTPTGAPTGSPQLSTSVSAEDMTGRQLQSTEYCYPTATDKCTGCTMLADYSSSQCSFDSYTCLFGGSFELNNLLPQFQFASGCNTDSKSSGYFMITLYEDYITETLSFTSTITGETDFVVFNVSSVGSGTLSLTSAGSLLSSGWTAPVITAGYTEDAIEQCTSNGIDYAPTYGSMFTLSPYISGGLNGLFYGLNLGGNFTSDYITLTFNGTTNTGSQASCYFRWTFTITFAKLGTSPVAYMYYKYRYVVPGNYATITLLSQWYYISQDQSGVGTFNKDRTKTPTTRPTTYKPSMPTRKPTSKPTSRPSNKPTRPTSKPTNKPTSPTRKPSTIPTSPTRKPSTIPTTPTNKPTKPV